MHISELAQTLRYGELGGIDFAIIDAASVDDKGNIVLGSGVGNIPTLARMAKKIVIELNSSISPEIEGFHDIYIPSTLPTAARYLYISQATASATPFCVSTHPRLSAS